MRTDENKWEESDEMTGIKYNQSNKWNKINKFNSIQSIQFNTTDRDTERDDTRQRQWQRERRQWMDVSNE